MTMRYAFPTFRYRETDFFKIANNAWKAGTSDSNDTVAGCSFSPSGACFTDRKLAGVRAYHEWMPIRQVEVDDQLRIWRNFQIGKLLVSGSAICMTYTFVYTTLGFNNA